MDIFKLREVICEQRDNEENSWAVRDIKHGKTVYFKTLEDLIQFVEKMKK